MTIPRIRSESPAFDLHHPEIAALEYADNEGLSDSDQPSDAPQTYGRARHIEEQLSDLTDKATGEGTGHSNKP